MLLGGNYKRSSETGPDTTTSLEQRSRDKSQPTGTCKTSTGRSQWVAAWCEQTWVQEGNLGPARTLQITGQAGAQSITKQSANACPSIPFACLVCFSSTAPLGGLQMPMRLVLLRIPDNHPRVSTKPTLFMPCAPTKLHFRWEPAKVRAASINSPTCHPHCKMVQKQCTSHIKDKQTCNNHQQNPIGKRPQGRGERKEERNVANRTKILAKKSV